MVNNNMSNNYSKSSSKLNIMLSRPFHTRFQQAYYLYLYGGGRRKLKMCHFQQKF